MAKQIIDIGTAADDGTGDPHRTAFAKANGNFNELYAADAALDSRVDALETSGAPPTSHAATHAEGGADPITVTQAQVTGLAAALAAKAPLASPALTGTPTAPTPPNGDNSTKIATTAFVLANGGGGGGSVPVQKNGVEVVAKPSALNFTGDGVTVTDNAGVPAINIPGGGTPAWYKQETRTVGATNGDAVELAQIDATDFGAVTLLVTLQFIDTGGVGWRGAVYHYTIPIDHHGTAGAWQIVQPDKFAMFGGVGRRGGRLEINITGGATNPVNTIKLRAVKDDDRAAGCTVVATILILGRLADLTYTSAAAVGSSAITATYGATNPMRRAVVRTVSNMVGQYVEIGQWTGVSLGMILRVTATVISGTNVRVASTYLLPVSESTESGWREVPPVAQSASFSSRTHALEASYAGGTLALRLTKASGVTYTAQVGVVMELVGYDYAFAENGASIPQFVELSGTGASTASTSPPWDAGDRRPVRAVSAAYTAGQGDRVIIADTTAAAFTVTLPSANVNTKGLELRIKNKGSNTLTVSGSIDGGASKAVAASTGILLVCTGTDWQTV